MSKAGSVRSIASILTLVCLCSCRTAYYGAMEKVGIHKRDIMVDRVQDARNSQESAKGEMKDALTLFSEVVQVEGGDLEKKYSKLKKAFDRCEAGAEDVRQRIRAVETVSRDLFKEWRKELEAYSNASLRRASKQQYDSTYARYGTMIEAMHRAAKKMDPVLDAFRDQVLFLKHNLNSRAIASIQAEVSSIEKDVARLIKEMESSIAEADAFIAELGKE